MSLSPVQQRFDDRLATILAIDTSHRNGANNLWTQLVDLVAQARERLSTGNIERALAALSLLKDRVDIDVRRRSAQAIAGRCRSAPLAVLLSGDRSPVVCALFDHLRLDDADWAVILPVVGPLARSRLRQRLGDLPPSAVRVLELLATGDLGLPQQVEHMMPVEVAADRVGHGRDDKTASNPAIMTGNNPDLPESAGSSDAGDSNSSAATIIAAATIVPAAVVPADAPSRNIVEPDKSPTSIAELVRRIDDWRRDRPANDSLAVPTSPSQVRLTVDTDGLVRAAEGLPNAAICGLSFAEPARPEQTGVDAGVARAFARRAPIHGGRLYMAPGLPWSGLWTLSATPQFDDGSGRFLGYRGAMVPAEVGRESAVGDAPHQPAQPLAEAMRQMVHELRSPLNAVSGFAQLIEGQYFGPVSSNYRSMVETIRADALSLLRVFDDLDLAARIDLASKGDRRTTAIDTIDLVANMQALMADGHGRGTIIRSDTRKVPVTAAVEPLNALLSRLLDLIGHQRGGEQKIVRVTSDVGGHMVMLEMNGIGAHDSGDSQAMPMGQDFSLRLIEQLAADAGAELDFSGDKAILNFRGARQSIDRAGAGPA